MKTIHFFGYEFDVDTNLVEFVDKSNKRIAFLSEDNITRLVVKLSKDGLLLTPYSGISLIHNGINETNFTIHFDRFID